MKEEHIISATLKVVTEDKEYELDFRDMDSVIVSPITSDPEREDVPNVRFDSVVGWKIDITSKDDAPKYSLHTIWKKDSLD